MFSDTQAKEINKMIKGTQNEELFMQKNTSAEYVKSKTAELGDSLTMSKFKSSSPDFPKKSDEGEFAMKVK